MGKEIVSPKRQRALLLLEEAEAEEELVAAKAAFRADPTPATAEAKKDAALRVRAIHIQTRAGRSGIGVKAGG